MNIYLLFLWICCCVSCSTDWDCSLSGDCINSVCKCSPGWKGDFCEQLDLLPIKVNSSGHILTGYYGTFSSWGASVIEGDDEIFHMFVSQMANGCGLGEWKSNSFIMHAISSTPLGPFKSLSPILPPFHHNPSIIKINGTYVLYFIGNDVTDSKNCSSSSSSLAEGNSGIVSLAYASSLDGPWQVLNNGTNIINGTTSKWFQVATNPSPFLLSNGSILLVFHAGNSSTSPLSQSLGLAIAQSWEGPYELISINRPLFRQGNNEDPYLWQDSQNNFHILTHREDLGAGVGGHAFSKNLIDWQLSPYAAYNLTIELSNGTNMTLARRERPQLLLENGIPRYLYNGVESVTGGSHSFTIVSEVAVNK